MTDEEVLKARVEELMENLDYYLRNYHRLIGIGYRKASLLVELIKTGMTWMREVNFSG